MSNDKVSLKDVYEVTNRIEDKLDRVTKDLDDRVTNLENWRSNLMGKISMVVAGISIAMTVIIDWIRKRINL